MFAFGHKSTRLLSEPLFADAGEGLSSLSLASLLSVKLRSQTPQPAGSWEDASGALGVRGERRPENRAMVTLSHRAKKGLWEKEPAPRAWALTNSSPAWPFSHRKEGRALLPPEEINQDPFGQGWPARQRPRMHFKGTDMARHQPTHPHVVFTGKIA